MPRLTSGFSTAAESDIRTGSGQNQVEYNMNAPVSVDGGAGFDKLVILATEYADHIVVTSGAIYGVGLFVTYARIEVLEIDALEGDDAIDVLSTSPGVATRVIGGLGNDVVNVAGDVTGDVFALDVEGTSSTINHAVSSQDPRYNGLLAAGLDLSVARAGQGSVVITESGGFSAVYEGGCFGLPGTCTPVPAMDAYTVYLASKPACAPGVADADCWVYVTVSVAYPPQSEHRKLALGTIPDGEPQGSDGDTFLVTDGGLPGSAADFLRQITLNGDPKSVQKRSIVLAFNGLTYATPQNVYMYAVDDTRAEGTRVVTASHSVIQTTCDPSKPRNCFDGAVVRNVETTVYDNDQPGVLLTQLDPTTSNPDNSSVVLEGWGTAVAGANGHPVTEELDRYQIVLASAPVGDVWLDLVLSDGAADPTRVCLSSSDARFTSSVAFADPTSCPPTPITYRVRFTSGNWFIPVTVVLHARNDFAPEDPHNTTITHTMNTTLTTDAGYLDYSSAGTKTAIVERVDVLVLDDENPGVWALASDGKTLVTACAGDPCTAPGIGDSYRLRLNSQPTATVKIALITDGQADVVLGGGVTLESVGGLQASQAFSGNLTVSGTGPIFTITRANGSDLGNFLDEGFVIGQRIRISGISGTTAADGDYVITNLGILTLTVTSAPALPLTTSGTGANGTYTGVLISQLRSRGVFEGDIAYDANGLGYELFTGDLTFNGSTTVTRSAGSFSADGLMVGTRIKFSNHATIYTINAVGEKTLLLSAAAPSLGLVHGVTINKVTGTLVRTDLGSWLDAGFLEGQLIKLDGLAPCADGNVDGQCLYKIELISGTDPNLTNKISLTSTRLVAAPSPYKPDELPGAGTAHLTVVQWAAVATFQPPTAGNPPQTCPTSPVDKCGTWYQGVTVSLLADPFFQLAPGRSNRRTFGKQQHLLSGIRGPLAVEGGTTSADRSLHAAVTLPGEGNGPVFRVAPQPPEWQQIDTLNIYGDGSMEDLTGNLTSTALSGLNMGAGLDFSNLLCSNVNIPSTCKHPFNEPGKYPGGISYGSISIDPATRVFTTDGTLSTVEIVNVLLGAGNDRLTIDSTLQPGGDFNPITGLRGELAHHGGVTAVHGGGNALLMVDGTFTATAAPADPLGSVVRLTRDDGLAWTRYGFQVGQQVTLPNGSSYTVTGFRTGTYAGDTMLLGGGSALLGALAGQVAVSDQLAVTGAFQLSSGLTLNALTGLSGVLLTNGQAWQSLGFAVGQQVYLPGYGVRTVVGFANSLTVNPSDATPRDGAVLLVNGSALPATTLNGTVSVTSRNLVASLVTLTGTANGGTVTLSTSSTGTGLAVGQQVWITGVNNGTRTVSAISADGKVLTVTGGAIPTVAATNGTVARVRVGGDTVTMTGATFAGTVSTTPTSLTRSSGSWIADGFATGRQVILGGALSGVFTITNVTASTLTLALVNGPALTTASNLSATVTVLPVGAGPGQPYDQYAPLVIYGDTSQDGVWYGGNPHTQSLHNFGPKPMPHIEGTVVTLSRSADGFTGYINLISVLNGTSSGDFRRDGFAVGNELALGPASSPAVSAAGVVYDIYSNHLTRHTGSWVTDGFKVNQQVSIAGLPGTWTVKGFANDPTYGANAVLELLGPTLAPLPNQTMTVTAVSQYVGIIKAITEKQIVLNLAIAIADFPTPPGPVFPVANGATTAQRTLDFRVLNRVGNSAPFFVFPLANPFLYSGNDVLDARLLDWGSPTNALRPIGVTMYGGAGDDLLIGSQTGDQLAGGSGDDKILGQRGQDHVYGDSGFNVDLITRLLTVAVIGNGPAGYSAAQFKNKDTLTAGRDLLYGEGPGSAAAAFFATVGNDDDIIFGDHGVVTQDVSGARDVTKAVPSKPQKISTTSIGRQSAVLNDRFGVTPVGGVAIEVSVGVLSVDSKALQNGADDWIYGNVDRDVLVGGTGSDAIDGGVQDDLIFGDNVAFTRTLDNFTSPHFQTLTGTLLYSRSDQAPFPRSRHQRAAARRRHRPQLSRPRRRPVVGRVRRAEPLARPRRGPGPALGRQLRTTTTSRATKATTWSSASSARTPSRATGPSTSSRPAARPRPSASAPSGRRPAAPGPPRPARWSATRSVR